MTTERKVSTDTVVAYGLAMALDEALTHLFRIVEFHDADTTAFEMAIAEARAFTEQFEQVEVH